jgi:hypothetical protein
MFVKIPVRTGPKPTKDTANAGFDKIDFAYGDLYARARFELGQRRYSYV